MRNDGEYIDPVEELEDKFEAMAHHVGEHCQFFEESFERIEKLEKDSQKFSLLTPIAVIIIFFAFMSGYILRSVSTVDERIGKMETRDMEIKR